MKDQQNFFKVSANREMFVTRDELKAFGFRDDSDGSALRNCCRKVIAKRKEVNPSDICVFFPKYNPNIDGYEVMYTRFYTYDLEYIENLIKDFFNDLNISVISIEVDITLDLSITVVVCPKEGNIETFRDVYVERLYDTLKDYINVSFGLHVQSWVYKEWQQLKSPWKTNKKGAFCSFFVCYLYWSLKVICYNILDRGAYEYF